MAATVLFFGAIADLVGNRRIEIDPGPNATASSVLEKLIEDFPKLSRYRLKISVNQAYATQTECVKDGDEIAIFTAVSGG